MPNQTIFKRYELKYIITAEQKQKILESIAPYMSLDKYGKTTIRNLYFDTDNYLLIRRSIEKPVYKEKLRIRAYEKANSDTTVFAELKKKYNSIVYKRRIALPHNEALEWLCGIRQPKMKNQISNEINYFLNYYGTLHPTVFLSYQREAYYTKLESDFRLTFDSNIFVREDNLSLKADAYGTAILPENLYLMEIKCSGGIPLWMTKILSSEKIYKTSFSKYGTAYKNLIFKKGDKNDRKNI